MKKFNFIITIFIMLFFYIYITYITLLPSNIVILNKNEINIRKLPGIEITELIQTSNRNTTNSNIELKLLGKIPLKSINAYTIENIELVPIGKIIGLKLYTNGVLVVGFSEIEDKNNKLLKPYKESNIQEGDTIIKINNTDIEDIESLKNVVNDSSGNNMEMVLLRNGNIITTSITPAEIVGKQYKLGLWVKDAATGVGTITFYEPESKFFAALGHGITDSDTNKLISIDSGKLVTTKILNVKKGENGIPGEIKGTIINQNTIGEVLKNTQFGVFGILDDLTSLNIDSENRIKIASRDEIKVGEAQILCTVDDTNTVKEYGIEIQKIYYENDYNNKSMLIKISDKELLEKTGGIIRGLSGAPVIQNGKFIGAVTNVLVSNPEVGYAVFADLMVKELNF